LTAYPEKAGLLIGAGAWQQHFIGGLLKSWGIQFPLMVFEKLGKDFGEAIAIDHPNFGYQYSYFFGGGIRDCEFIGCLNLSIPLKHSI